MTVGAEVAAVVVIVAGGCVPGAGVVLNNAGVVDVTPETGAEAAVTVVAPKDSVCVPEVEAVLNNPDVGFAVLGGNPNGDGMGELKGEEVGIPNGEGVTVADGASEDAFGAAGAKLGVDPNPIEVVVAGVAVTEVIAAVNPAGVVEDVTG